MRHIWDGPEQPFSPVHGTWRAVTELAILLEGIQEMLEGVRQARKGPDLPVGAAPAPTDDDWLCAYA